MTINNQKPKETRIFVQVSLSKEEKKKIKDFAKKMHTTASNLMREAIFEYIRRIENPEMFTTNSNLQLNPALIEQLIQGQKKNLEIQELILERTNIMNEMSKTLDLIRKFSIKTEPTIKNTILSLFKAHNTLNPKDIIEKTNLDKEIVFSIITELQKEKLIVLNTNGRFKLR